MSESAGHEPKHAHRRLTKAYVGALLLIAAFFVGSEAVSYSLLSHHDSDARIINLAGRQRMLSQKIAKGVLAIELGIDVTGNTRILAHDLATWTRIHRGLRERDEVMELGGRNSANIKKLFSSIDGPFEEMRNAADQIVHVPLTSGPELVAAAQVISRAEGRYLALMDDIVFAYEDEARTRLRGEHRLEVALVLAALVGLWVVALVIFRPTAARVRRSLEQVVNAQRAAEELSYLDGLTGIANRRRFSTDLEREYRRAARERKSISVLMLDLDGFKALNDWAGHVRGDDALVKVAIELSAQMRRSGDLVARYGGDEFAVCLPDTDLVGAGRVAMRLRTAVAELNIPVGPESTGRRLAISVGIASVVPEPAALDPEHLVLEADHELYQEKSRRSQIRIVPA